MILSIDEVMIRPEFSGQDERIIRQKMDALELLIRKHTNNNFQNRYVRFSGKTVGNRIFGYHPFLRVGDTIQITESQVNDGLYVVKEIGKDWIRVDKELFRVDHNLLTKVEYPMDVKQGVLNLLNYENTMRDKVGIKSETISRHSVTYYDQDTNNQVMGYPVSLLGFLKPYMKARF